MNPNAVIVQACYVNGKVCRNGKRDDFEVNPHTGEKFFCNKWVQLMGSDPQTGQPLNEWCCAEVAKIKIALEGTQAVRQNTASTDKVANQVAQHRAEFIGALPEEAKGRLIEVAPQITTEPLPALTLQKEQVNESGT